MRRQDSRMNNRSKNYLKNSQKSSSGHVSKRNDDRQSRCHQPTREMKARGKCWHPRDAIVVCAVQAPPSTGVQSTAYQPNTYVDHVALTGMQKCCSALPSHSPNVASILITSSPDFDVLNQQRVVVMTDFIRMLSGNVVVNVFKSDAVIWDKMLHLSKSQGSAMSRNLREAISDLCRLAPLRLTNPRGAELSVHRTIVPGEQLHILVSRCDALASSTNQCHQLGLTRPHTNHVLFLGRRIHGIPRVFNRTLHPNCDSRVASTIFDVSSPIVIGHHHD